MLDLVFQGKKKPARSGHHSELKNSFSTYRLHFSVVFRIVIIVDTIRTINRTVTTRTVVSVGINRTRVAIAVEHFVCCCTAVFNGMTFFTRLYFFHFTARSKHHHEED